MAGPEQLAVAVVDTGAVVAVTARELATDWSLRPVTLVAVAAAAWLYAAGVGRLAVRGRRWPRPRSAAFGAGCVVLIVATQSGLATHDTTSFSAHVAQHLLLGMAAPVLLASGAPLTLALQSAPLSVRRGLRHLLHSPALRVAFHPVLTWVVFAGSLWLLYVTPLFEWSVRSPIVHEAVHLHFLLAGAAFFWAIADVDASPRRLPAPAKLLAVGLAVPLHAFLGLALMRRGTPLYGQSLEATHLGGAIMWVAGDLLAIAVLGMVVGRWIADEDLAATREDRVVDARAAAAALAPEASADGSR